jgi:hypothetical protein
MNPAAAKVRDERKDALLLVTAGDPFCAVACRFLPKVWRTF